MIYKIKLIEYDCAITVNRESKLVAGDTIHVFDHTITLCSKPKSVFDVAIYNRPIEHIVIDLIDAIYCAQAASASANALCTIRAFVQHGGREMVGWIGVDLDGTLAKYDTWQGELTIGDPVNEMVQRIHKWISKGFQVKIVTARVASSVPVARREKIINAIDRWCEVNLGYTLPVVAEKDFAMLQLWDDRCVQVVPNTGDTLQSKLAAAASDAVVKTLQPYRQILAPDIIAAVCGAVKAAVQGGI